MTWRPSTSGTAGEPKPVSDGLDAIARRLGGPGAGLLLTVFGGWSELVGAQVAAHSRPLSLRDGVLSIGTDQPAWATQLRYLSAELLRRLHDRGLEGVSRIEVKVMAEGPGIAPARRSRPQARQGPRVW